MGRRLLRAVVAWRIGLDRSGRAVATRGGAARRAMTALRGAAARARGRGRVLCLARRGGRALVARSLTAVAVAVAVVVVGGLVGKIDADRVERRADRVGQVDARGREHGARAGE